MDNPSIWIIRLFARIYTQYLSDELGNACLISVQVPPDGLSVSSINRANGGGRFILETYNPYGTNLDK